MIRVDVLSLHCSQDDAKYLKHLLVEASSQKKVEKGLFIPAGIHLIEGKETLNHILTEHTKFVEETTSFQMEGISTDEMYKKQEPKDTTEGILLKGPGVKAIESTHLTAYKGQWILVVQTSKVTELMKYIESVLPEIYRNKSEKKNKTSYASNGYDAERI